MQHRTPIILSSLRMYPPREQLWHMSRPVYHRRGLTGIDIFECSPECCSPYPQGPIRELPRLPPSNQNAQVDLVHTLGSHTSRKPADRDVHGVGVVPLRPVPPIGAGFELPAGLRETPWIKGQDRFGFEVDIILPVSDIIVDGTEPLALVEAKIAPKMI